MSLQVSKRELEQGLNRNSSNLIEDLKDLNKLVDTIQDQSTEFEQDIFYILKRLNIDKIKPSE